MARKTICDRCGNTVSKGYMVEIQVLSTGFFIPIPTLNKQFDLCPKCKDALLEYLAIDKDE